MSSFTWTRGRGGVSGSVGSDTILNCELGTYTPGTLTTVRRIIIDWGVDLEASTEAGGAINVRSPVTVGLISTTSGDTTPSPPDFGPNSDPNVGWTWWTGAWYGANYGISPTASSPLLMSANGRINRTNPIEMSDNSAYTTWWLVVEIEDAPGGWNTAFVTGWWQFLTAPTVA